MHIFRGIWLIAVLATPQALALPIGFGRPPAGLEYNEVKSKNFFVYHDHRATHEAKQMLNALEAARPHMENWFKERRSSPLPVIMSATTAHASFANFVTDALEIQTLGQGSRDLAWHEYTHAMMYEHFHNWLGPAGSILHLMWLPSWYVEGLAEALSVSIGSDEMASIERYYALTDRWPTYDRLHSLYSDPSFSYQGYAVSGALVSYMFRNLDHAQVLPDFLNFYFRKSMPWYWPYSMFPFEQSMPLENALREFHQIGGPRLYLEYKAAAKAHWEKANVGPMFTKEVASRGTYGLTSSMQVRGDQIYKVRADGDDFYEAKIEFKGKWAVDTDDVMELPGDLSSSSRAITPELQVFAFDKEDLTGNHSFQIFSRAKAGGALTPVAEGDGSASDVMLTKSAIIWKVTAEENTSICFTRRGKQSTGFAKKDEITCPFRFAQPEKIEVMGARRNADGVTERVWMAVTRQTVRGDDYRMIDWQPEAAKHVSFSLAEGGKPIAAALGEKDNWILIGERDRRVVRKVDSSGQCLGTYSLGDLATGIHLMPDDSLVMPLFMDDDRVIVRIPKREVVLGPCYQAPGHVSPLLAAMNRPRKVKTLTQAVQAASIWRRPKNREVQFLQRRTAKAKDLDKDKVKGTGTEDRSKPAQWRGRPVFGVPWLGADADGTQMGLLSVPLMDHMQNEEIRLYLAYGVNSRFPHSEISFRTTRFWPTLQVDAFRYQTWNGQYFKVTDPVDPANPDADNDGEEDSPEGFYANAFVDERGVRVSSETFLHSIATTMTLGVKFSNIRPYRGRGRTRQGRLNEPFANISKVATFGRLAWINSAFARVAPEDINESFEYNQVGLGTKFAYSFDFLSSIFTLGAEGSRTRGKKPRELQEVYRPLKVFVPGSGGGYNNLSFPLLGNGGLFDARFGNTQFRSSTSYSFPLWRRVDKVVRLLYFEQLTFTSFLNYGGAWTGDLEPKRSDLIAAHGYNFDLHFDVKGFNFHVGQGWGQVFGSPLETYLTFSFDAIF